MAEFKTERVYFTVIGQGSLEVEYIVGEETPIEAFRKAFPETDRGLSRLMSAVSDFNHVITCATEPYPPERDEEPEPSTFDGEEYDTTDMFVTPRDGRITIPVAGLYHISPAGAQLLVPHDEPEDDK